jgi:hypothetical protein
VFNYSAESLLIEIHDAERVQLVGAQCELSDSSGVQLERVQDGPI